MSDPTKFVLSERDIPEKWYNIIADMPNKPLPPLHPATHEPIGPEALAPLFPMELIKQEVTGDTWVEIPEEVRAQAVASIERWFKDNADEPIGSIQAAALLNFFVAETVVSSWLAI